KGVRTWPGGKATRTRTASPTPKRAFMAASRSWPLLRAGRPLGGDLGHAAAEFVHRDDALLQQVVGDRGNPALVVAHLVVGPRAELLDAAAQLVGGDEPALAVRQQ